MDGGFRAGQDQMAVAKLVPMVFLLNCFCISLADQLSSGECVEHSHMAGKGIVKTGEQSVHRVDHLAGTNVKAREAR